MKKQLLTLSIISLLLVSCNNNVPTNSDESQKQSIEDSVEESTKPSVSTHEHTFEETYSYDGLQHWKEATCGHEDATIKEDHQWDEGTVTKEATCSSEKETKFECTECGYSKTEKGEKLDHKMGSTLLFDNDKHYYKCENCNYTSNEVAHNKTVEYYTNTEGKLIRKEGCSDCGYNAEGEVGSTTLTDLTYTHSGGYQAPGINRSCLSSALLLAGFPLTNAISLHPSGEEAKISFDLSDNNYDTFVAVIGKTDQKLNCNVQFVVYVDDVVKYTSPLMKEDMKEFVEVDIKGASKLTLAVNNGGDGFSFDEAVYAYPRLINKVNLQPVSIQPQNIDYVQEKGQELNIQNASALVTYTTDAFKEVNINEIEITGYDKNKIGKQTLTLKYGEATSTYDVYTVETNKYVYLKDLPLKGKASYFEPTIGKECEDLTALKIAGIDYKNGIGLHPVGVGNPGYLEYDISSVNYGTFHAVLGQTKNAIAYDVRFKILGDGTELYNKILVPGQIDVVDIDITGYSTLTIQVLEGNDNTISFGGSGVGEPVIYTK